MIDFFSLIEHSIALLEIINVYNIAQLYTREKYGEFSAINQ